LDICLGEAGGVLDGTCECSGDRDDVGAVDERRGLAKNLELSHSSLELGGHGRLVVDHVLPQACGARVLGDGEVALQAHFTSDGGQNLSSMGGVSVSN
jgi:hypothetical protein